VDPGPYGRAKWKVRLAVPIFVIVLVIVTGEGLSRLIPSREAQVLWVDHPLCFQVQVPDAKVARPLGETTFDYETDHFGFRGASVKTAKRPQDAYRIVFLGEDATLAANLPEAQTFPSLVEQTLEKRRDEKDPRIEVANAAGPGFFLPVVHATLVQRVLPVEPDMVVVMCAAADARAALGHDWSEDLAALAPRPEPPSFADWFCTVSGFAHLIRAKARAWGFAVAPRARTPIDALGAEDAGVDPKRALVSYRRYLGLTATVCKKARAELVFLTQPTLYKESLTPEEKKALPHGQDESLRKAIDLFNEELRSAAPREGARLVDLASLMTRDLDHLKDDESLTPKGHAVAAQMIIEDLWKDKPARR
jgi:hypothetical protein